MTRLDKLQKVLNKKFPDSMTVLPGSDKQTVRKVDTISTGSIKLNRALGVGGYPRGRIVELFGPNSSGKTTLALHAAAEANKLGLWVLYIDLEYALDLEYAKSIGVEVDNPEMFAFSQPSDGEDAFRIIQSVLESEEGNSLGVIVLDSVAAIRSKYETESEIGDSHIGQAARLINAANRALVPLIARKNVVMIYINQERANIGSYGGGTTTTGGKSIEYFASVRMRISRDNSRKIVSNKVEVGVYTKANIIKNKLAPAYKLADMKLMYGKGIDSTVEIVDELVNRGKLIKAGSWIKLPSGESLGQGAESVLQNHYDLCIRLLEEPFDEPDLEIIEIEENENYDE